MINNIIIDQVEILRKGWNIDAYDYLVLMAIVHYYPNPKIVKMTLPDGRQFIKLSFALFKEAVPIFEYGEVKFKSILKNLEKQGLVERSDGYVRLTEKYFA